MGNGGLDVEGQSKRKQTRLCGPPSLGVGGLGSVSDTGGREQPVIRVGPTISHQDVLGKAQHSPGQCPRCSVPDSPPCAPGS